MHIPLERFILNVLDEIPLPDKGNILIQHEIGTNVIPFYRPVDQYPPYATKTCIENLFKCLTVDYVIEIFFQLALERKLLMVSRHKSLLTQACISLMSFIFPLCWKHTLIPILPIEMIDVLDAPLPFLIGIESGILSEAYPDLSFEEVTQVNLDANAIYTSELVTETSRMPQKELRTLREKLMRATASIK